jgi:serpin B
VDLSRQLPPEARVLGSLTNRLSLALDRAQRSLPAVPGRNQNLLVSPIGMFITLALLYEGSRGPTRAELAKVLGLEGSQVSLAEGVRALSKSLNSYSAVTLEVATSLWLQRGFSILPDFRRVATDSYGAQVDTIDFATERDAAVGRINSWADSHTRHLISQAIAADSLGKRTQFLAVDAVYFLGKWAKPFKRSRTMPRTFYTASGAELEVPTMLQKALFRYSITPLGQSISLPYADKDASLLIILPEDQKWFTKPLPENFLDVCTRDMQFQTIDFELPKFDLQQGLNWVPSLRRLGLSNALGQGAAFDGITGGSKLKLSAVDQQVRIRVDDEEVTAAATAATEANPGLSTMSDERPIIDFRVNRPFLFALRSERAGAVLLWGRVGSF